VKIGKSASETLAKLALAYSEYTMKKSSVLNGIGGFKKGDNMCVLTQEVGSQNHKAQMHMWTEYEP
jgi:hypothetical protein